MLLETDTRDLAKSATAAAELGDAGSELRAAKVEDRPERVPALVISGTNNPCQRRRR